MVDTESYRIESPDGREAALELPAGLVDVLSEQGENPSEVVVDVALQAFVQQAHVIVHHSEGETPEDLVEINETAEELFEERFGRTVAEAFGHDH